MDLRNDNERKVEIRKRLVQAFGELRREGFIARANFTCCQSCGTAEISDMVAKKKKENKQTNGYVFWHKQDDDCLFDTAQILLAYGKVEGGNITTVDVGQIIKKKLESKGLVIVWDGNSSSRIMVAGIWERVEYCVTKESNY